MNKPIVWTIAGSDSGGGAGIQADIKTITQLGAYAASVITAVTAQNTKGVRSIAAIDASIVRDQLEALQSDLRADVVKLGMLYSPEIMHEVQGYLPLGGTFIVCDPVMVATSGDALNVGDYAHRLREDIIPACSLITPNLEEAHVLLDRDVSEFRALKIEEREGYIRNLAHQLLNLGCQSVLIKSAGGIEGFAQDFWLKGITSAWLSSDSTESRETHGTGCTLASAISSAIALGFEELDAIVIAKAYVNQGIRLAPGIGYGHGPLAHLDWPEAPEDLPWISPTVAQGAERPEFPGNGRSKLGFYPIVDSVPRLRELIKLGVETAQLRIKDASVEEIAPQIEEAVQFARQNDCRLFINDYWQLAIEKGAFGVHLGQEDLVTADIAAIEQSGLRLGVSAHSYSEVARALALRPSYIAIGPIFPTTSKVMRFAPQGLESFKRWRKSLDCPLVAIGGISLENALPLLEAGADSIAVLGDVSKAIDLRERVTAWQKLFHTDVRQASGISA